jgi:hypothetical protein
MRRFDQTSALCQVFTYKEGVLSGLAHDLRIAVTSFTLELEGKDHFISARFDAASLRVDCAMVEGKPRPDLLSSIERKEIEDHIIKDVLDVRTHKEITLLSTSVTKEDSSYSVDGLLSVRGVTRKISFQVRDEGNLYVAEVRLHMPDFGIKPFTIFFGAVKLKPDILIRVEIPGTTGS